jgi:hypothetical protein
MINLEERFFFSVLKQITKTKLSVDLLKLITFMIHLPILLIYLSIATEISFFLFCIIQTEYSSSINCY